MDTRDWGRSFWAPEKETSDLLEQDAASAVSEQDDTEGNDE